MNGYERIKSALEGRQPDRTPVMLHNFMMAAHEAGYTMEEFREDPRKIAESFIKSVEKYVKILEEVISEYPFQWFNFYQYWQ